MTWQPIATAPKVIGQLVDLWADDCRWPDCSWTGEYWFSPHGIFDCGAEMELHDHFPTHWMLIPFPPNSRPKEMIEDADQARIKLYIEHCQYAEDQTTAIAQLSGQLLHQSCICLKALYGGNMKMVNAHIMLLLTSICEEDVVTDE